MTPQLLQAIKLLQMSAQELDAFVEAELERNPLIEIAPDPDAPPALDERPAPDARIGSEAEWETKQLDPSRGEIDPRGETNFENVYQDDPSDRGATFDAPHLASQSLSATDWTSARASGFDEDESIFDTIADKPESLRDHLVSQLHLTTNDHVVRRIGEALIDMIDEAGYIRVNRVHRDCTQTHHAV